MSDETEVAHQTAEFDEMARRAETFLPANLPGSQAKVMACSWRAESFADKRRSILCLQPADIKVDDLGGDVFLVRHVAVVFVRGEQGQDGEIISGIKTLFFDPQDRQLSTWSSAAPSFVNQLVAAFGMPPWSPPIKMLIEEYKTAKGLRAYAFDVEE